jgi:SAM-dependent methyltransferase
VTCAIANVASAVAPLPGAARRIRRQQGVRDHVRAHREGLVVNRLAPGRGPLGDLLQHGRRRIAQASIASIPFQAATFDLVTSFDVFQCLPDPVEGAAVREMARVLKPGGAAVFNFAALDVLRGSQSVLAEEVRRYTPGQVRQLLEGAGLAVERLSFTYASLFPLLLAVRVGHRYIGRNGEAELGEWEIEVPSPPVNTLLSAAVGAEALALRAVNMPFGSSIMCLARKPL